MTTLVDMAGRGYEGAPPPEPTGRPNPRATGMPYRRPTIGGRDVQDMDIRLPREVHADLKLLAAENGRSTNAEVELAATALVEAWRARRAGRKG